MKPPPHRPSCRGFVLLEIIIALTVFAIAVTGLAVALHSALDASNDLRRHASVRRGMESLLAEARQQTKREEMQLTRTDETLGLTFQSTLEELKWTNRTGAPVRGLYRLRVVASRTQPDAIPENSAEIYVYRP
jgi:prepilin-type N-terminal cleavage/methylation domain-containing protein